MVNFQVFQNTQSKHFSWSLLLLTSEIVDFRPVTLREKGQFCKDFLFEFSNFKNILFFLRTFRKVSVVEFLDC